MMVVRQAGAGFLRGARRDGRAIGPLGIADVAIRGVTQDSRDIATGNLFVAIEGQHVDGHEFVAAAARLGAAAAVVERPVPEVGLPQLVVTSSAVALAMAAGWRYGDPSHELGVIGITGTDGKTTTAFLATTGPEAARVPSG